MNLKLSIRILLILILSILVLFSSSDVIELYSASSEFVFGTEAYGWKYKSKINFLIFNET